MYEYIIIGCIVSKIKIIYIHYFKSEKYDTKRVQDFYGYVLLARVVEFLWEEL